MSLLLALESAGGPYDIKVYQAFVNTDATPYDIKVFQAFFNSDSVPYDVKVYQAWFNASAAVSDWIIRARRRGVR